MSGEVSNIVDTKFEELKEHIRSKYGSLLPDSSYDSPESLYKALEALQKHTGYSHIYNARAFKVLEAAVHSSLVFTTRDLSERFVYHCIVLVIVFTDGRNIIISTLQGYQKGIHMEQIDIN